MNGGTIFVFSIAQVPPMIKMKTERAKNKVFKPQGAIKYLALIYFTLYIYIYIYLSIALSFL
jgi:hypothetical protein